MFAIIFLCLCKRNSNLIYALHKRNVFTFLTHLWHFHLSVMKRGSAPAMSSTRKSVCVRPVMLYPYHKMIWLSRPNASWAGYVPVCLDLSLSVSFLLANLYDLVELNIFLHCADKHLFYLATGKHLTRLQKWLPLRLISIKSMKSRSTVRRVFVAVFNLV